MNNGAKTIKIVTMMFGAFGQANDTNRIKIYAQFLASFPSEVVNKAVQKTILNCKFLPTIAELTEAIKELTGTANEGMRVKTWDEAWCEIQRKMQSTPWGKSPEWSTPEIEAAVNSFGWHDLQCVLTADMPTVRAQVRRIYEDTCNRLSKQAQNQALLGKGGNILGIAERTDNEKEKQRLIERSV